MALTEKTVDINIDNTGREQSVILSDKDIRILDRRFSDPIFPSLNHSFVLPVFRPGALAVSAFLPSAWQTRSKLQASWSRQFLLNHVVMVKAVCRSAACCLQMGTREKGLWSGKCTGNTTLLIYQ
jgi:hypothetical protein